MVSPLGSPTAIGVIPKVRRFVVVGIFDSGMSEIDSTLVYMNLADAQKFFELPDAVTNIEIRVQDVYHAQDVAQEIQRRLGFPYLTEDWSRLVAQSVFCVEVGKNRLLFGIASDGLDRRIQYYIHADYGGNGKEKGYCNSSIHGRDPRKYSKDIPTKRLCDRRCGNLSWCDLGTGHLYLDTRISFHRASEGRFSHLHSSGEDLFEQLLARGLCFAFCMPSGQYLSGAAGGQTGPSRNHPV